MSDQRAARVVDAPDRERYELVLGGEVRGYLSYRRHPGIIILIHTEVDPALQGQGQGSVLAQHALDEARQRGERVVPRCPFVRRFIDEHPEYASLVAGTPSAG
ncbi:MAG: N-acetyltransferase [Candidatus Dormibacteraeota bacterium]|nr:N-acetyltransferase [Candidatus Dormibacteraeota bacterium]